MQSRDDLGFVKLFLNFFKIKLAGKADNFWQDYVAGFGGRNFGLQNNQNYFINVSKNCNWTP